MDELLQNTTTASSCPTSGKYKNNNINIFNGQTIAKEKNKLILVLHGTSSHYQAVRQPFDLREKQSYLGC